MVSRIKNFSIESYHFFEHLDHEQARKTLKEWFRILKPGGSIIVELPNLARCIEEINKHFNRQNIDLAMAGIFGYPPDVMREGVGQIHKWGWTPETLGSELSDVEFVDVQLHPIKQTRRPAANFGRDMQIRAVKPL